MNPAATAAMLLPSPPRMATAKPFSARPAPMAWCVEVMGETTQPASAPMPALRTKESVTRFLTGSPQSAAASRFAAQARISRPSMANLKKRFSATTTTAHAPRLHSTCGERCTLPIAIEVDSSPLKYGRERQREDGVQRHRRHAAEHHELALREVDDTGGVVDDVEADADDGVDGAVGEPGDEVLEEEADHLSRLLAQHGE